MSYAVHAEHPSMICLLLVRCDQVSGLILVTSRFSPVHEICDYQCFVCKPSLSNVKPLSDVVLASKVAIFMMNLSLLCLPYHVMWASECQEDRTSEGRR
jgi:hypothetical protein